MLEKLKSFTGFDECIKMFAVNSFYKEVWMRLAEFVEVLLPNDREYPVEWIRQDLQTRNELIEICF